MGSTWPLGTHARTPPPHTGPCEKNCRVLSHCDEKSARSRQRPSDRLPASVRSVVTQDHHRAKMLDCRDCVRGRRLASHLLRRHRSSPRPCPCCVVVGTPSQLETILRRAVSRQVVGGASCWVHTTLLSEAANDRALDARGLHAKRNSQDAWS